MKVKTTFHALVNQVRQVALGMFFVDMIEQRLVKTLMKTVYTTDIPEPVVCYYKLVNNPFSSVFNITIDSAHSKPLYSTLFNCKLHFRYIANCGNRCTLNNAVLT